MIMRRLATIAATALFLAGSIIATTAGPARADSVASRFPIGAVFQGSIDLPYARVPLPVGEWTVTALNETRNSQNATIASLTLVNIVYGKLVGHIAIDTNVDPGQGGWDPYRYCARKDLFFLQTDANYAKDQACWGINHVVMDATSGYRPTYGLNIRQALAERDIAMPRLVIDTTFRFANDTAFLTYEILLNVAAFGFPTERETTWANSPWHRDLVSRDPKRLGFLDEVKARHAAFYPALRSQFR